MPQARLGVHQPPDSSAGGLLRTFADCKSPLFAAAGLLPVDCAAAAICKSGHPRLAAHALQSGAMGIHNGSEVVIDGQPHIVMPPSGQHLFSLYMHTPPDYQGYPPDSPFHGREVTSHLTQPRLAAVCACAQNSCISWPSLHQVCI